MLVSGKTSGNASNDKKKVCDDYEEVTQNMSYFQFDGQGQRPTPIADLRTTVLVVLRLRSKVAQKLSAKVVDIFIRYIGGDLELAKEVLANREFQEQHPARAFGEAVVVEPSRPPPQIVNIPGMDAGDHAYLFHSGVPGIMKIGRATDVGLTSHPCLFLISIVKPCHAVHP